MIKEIKTEMTTSKVKLMNNLEISDYFYKELTKREFMDLTEEEIDTWFCGLRCQNASCSHNIKNHCGNWESSQRKNLACCDKFVPFDTPNGSKLYNLLYAYIENQHPPFDVDNALDLCQLFIYRKKYGAPLERKKDLIIKIGDEQVTFTTVREAVDAIYALEDVFNCYGKATNY